MKKQLSVREYKCRDGRMMIYVNGSNGASVGASARFTPSAYSKGMTNGKRNALDEFFKAVRNAPDARRDVDATPDTSADHCGWVIDLDHWGRAWCTDDGRIGGVAVKPGDGLYLETRDGKVVNLDRLADFVDAS